MSQNKCYMNCSTCEHSQDICSLKLVPEAISILLHSTIKEIDKALNELNPVYARVKDHDYRGYRRFELIIEFKSEEPKKGEGK